MLISVIIPVRNEAQNILELLGDLERQLLSTAFFEVIIVDDASGDQTVLLIREFEKSSSLRLRLIELSSVERNAAPKKRAIEAGISEASGELIVTTDGDCRVGQEWLSSIAGCRIATGALCISGPVTFTDEQSLTDYLQTVEFSSLIGTGACAIELGFPNMCNGANFAYTRDVFYQVDGFRGIDRIASGDDELLLHKIVKAFPGSAVFLKDQAAIVRTRAQDSWSGFVNQRKRWAGKWRAYQTASPKWVAVFIFLSNAAFLALGGLYISGMMSGTVFWTLLLLKVVPEWWFVGSVLRFLKKTHTLWCIPLVQLLYPFYVIGFGLLGWSRTYSWKGRNLK